MRYFIIAALCALLLVPTASSGGETPYAKAKRIVYAVFPASTEAAALRVVGCETGYSYSPWSRNRSSGALGWFQFIPGNHGRFISFGRFSMKIDYNRMYQPWYATRAAWILSQGGTDWGEWVCQP